MGKVLAEGSLGKRFGKSDLDRVGLFVDPSPAPFDEYRKPVEFREGVNKGRQMLAGTPAGLFEKKFVRIFEGEALTKPGHTEAEGRLQREARRLGGPMLPTSPSKKHSTPGDWHGCFDKPSYFSPQERTEGKKTRKVMREPPNMKIKPNPLGGPGYPDICLNPFPVYSHEPYDTERKGKVVVRSAGRFLTASAPLDYFPPDPYVDLVSGPTYVRPREKVSKMITAGAFYVPFPKKPGGKHDGCFDKFPEYSSEPYGKVGRTGKEESVFLSGGPDIRSKYTTSIIEQITRRSCNSSNYLDYRELAYPLR